MACEGALRRLCGVAKMLEEFHVNNSNADKHDTRCKACCALYEKVKRAKKTRVLEPTVSDKACRCVYIIHFLSFSHRGFLLPC